MSTKQSDVTSWAWACERMLEGAVVAPVDADGNIMFLRYGIKHDEGERNVRWWFASDPDNTHPLELDADDLTRNYVEFSIMQPQP